MRDQDRIDGMETESIQRVVDLYEESAERLRALLTKPGFPEVVQPELNRIEAHIKMLKGRIKERS